MVIKDNLPWRKGRDLEYQPIRVTKGKGKGKAIDSKAAATAELRGDRTSEPRSGKVAVVEAVD